MRKSSTGRRSSVNPVRVSMFDKDDRSLAQARGDPRKLTKSKFSVNSAESSHIPRPRIRTSSCDRANIRKSTLKTTGRTPLHQATTPITPIAGSSKYLTVPDPSYTRSPSGDRASNIGAKGPRKDTRPLNDKSYQVLMLNKIDTYFYSIQCASMLNSNGSLKPITLKMFVDVSNFLIKHLDVKHTFTVATYVEELPKIAKKLHYPGVVNKSWLKTANAMHSWPNVLGWLSWLVEVCEIRELAMRTYNVESLPFAGNKEDAEFNRYKFLSMLKFYAAWNDEKLDEEAALIDEYLQNIETQQGVTDDDLTKARTELESKMVELQAIEEKAKKAEGKTEKLKEMLSSLQEDELKQLNDIKAKEEYVADANTELKHLSAEYKILQEQIQYQNTVQDELNAIIKSQPMSKSEEHKIAEECGTIQNYMQQVNEHLEDLQREIYNLDLKLTSTNNNLHKKILAFNKEIFLHINDIDIDLEQLKMPEGSKLNPNMMEILNAKGSLMNDVKETLKQQLAEKKNIVESNCNRFESLQGRKKFLESEHKDLVDKIQLKKADNDKRKGNVQKEEKKLQKQIEALQSDIKDIQEHMPDMQGLTDELKEVDDKLAAVRRRKEYMEESAKLFFAQFYQIIGTHRNGIAALLKKHDANQGKI